MKNVPWVFKGTLPIKKHVVCHLLLFLIFRDKNRPTLHILNFRYPCDECDYSGTSIGRLKAHKESKHEGIRHQCKHCEYSGSSKLSLYTHTKRKHEEHRFKCSECDYSVFNKNGLKIHMKKRHKKVIS